MTHRECKLIQTQRWRTLLGPRVFPFRISTWFELQAWLTRPASEATLIQSTNSNSSYSTVREEDRVLLAIQALKIVDLKILKPLQPCTMSHIKYRVTRSASRVDSAPDGNNSPLLRKLFFNIGLYLQINVAFQFSIAIYITWAQVPLLYCLGSATTAGRPSEQPLHLKGIWGHSSLINRWRINLGALKALIWYYLELGCHFLTHFGHWDKNILNASEAIEQPQPCSPDWIHSTKIEVQCRMRNQKREFKSLMNVRKRYYHKATHLTYLSRYYCSHPGWNP